MMKKILLSALISISFFLFSYSQEKRTEVTSPDSRLKMVLNCKDSIVYSVFYKGKEIVNQSGIGLLLQDGFLGANPRIKDIRERKVNDRITPPYGKFKTLEDRYNEVTLDFEGNYSLVLRAYDEGLAYRFITNYEKDIVVVDERFSFNLTGDPSVYFPETDNWTSWELAYVEYGSESAIPDRKRAITPVLFSYPDGTKLVVAESDLLDYPGMYLAKDQSGFHGAFAQYPDSTALGSWGFVSVVQKRAGYIAKTSGKRNFPWRVFIVTDDDRSLLVNEVIYKLAEPQKMLDVSWIKPGKAAWEWWHDAMLPGEDIPSGMSNRNTELYKRYIDFAAEYDLEYLMIDAGWSHIFNLEEVNPKVDIQAIIDHGKKQNIGVFLWCTAMALTEETTDEYMKMIRDWGAVGLKVDFFDRDDQQAIKWYEYIARKAAEYQLMINFHGCSKPTGMQRTYPNIVNFEAVRGAECSKWDLTANPKHHVVFPFVRMLGGSLDYTPGSMRNRTQNMFRPIDPGLPLTQGTRCHELAMFVVYDQYFAMLCDSPAEYEKAPDVMKFLSAVPVSFDHTEVIAAEMGEYALVAKQKGKNWFIGGMTNWTARSLNLDFSFLPPGKKYVAHVYCDGFNSNTYADQYVYEKKELDTNSKLTVNMASGGGVAIMLKQKE